MKSSLISLALFIFSHSCVVTSAHRRPNAYISSAVRTYPSLEEKKHFFQARSSTFLKIRGGDSEHTYYEESEVTAETVEEEEIVEGVTTPPTPPPKEEETIIEETAVEEEVIDSPSEEDVVVAEESPYSPTKILTCMSSIISKMGASYSNLLDQSPIMTKSLTAGIIFAMSDYTAQCLEHKYKSDDTTTTTTTTNERKTRSSKTVTVAIDDSMKLNLRRTITSSLVGLLYFGPAAHSWYSMIFTILPETSLVSTLQKAILGQLIFGPVTTAIFFASSLFQSQSFTLSNWGNKIVKDLPGAWKAGLGFWPLVDLVSYSLMDPKWIPLFVNVCSFVWTIYLSSVAFRG